jgi:hypothetical protein
LKKIVIVVCLLKTEIFFHFHIPVETFLLSHPTIPLLSLYRFFSFYIVLCWQVGLMCGEEREGEGGEKEEGRWGAL